MFTNRRMVLYRGSLKSCNYHCSYCPFSKHKSSPMELERDKEQWFRFCSSLSERAKKLDIHALLAVPYGEALIHSWYWEGLGRLSQTEVIEAVGAQTNLSFPLEKSLRIYYEAGGKAEKLRLWATFHPDMVSVEKFAEICIQIQKEGILLSVGAVGVPKNLEKIQELRKMLPDEIYLWINRMDGKKRPYTEKEKADFQAIDPYFMRELVPVKADSSRCMGRMFVEGDGKLHCCNISPVLEENWYGKWEQIFLQQPACTRKYCSCYLAYGGRQEVMNQVMFGHYPLFRIPERPKAVFLDINGTLIPEGEKKVPNHAAVALKALAEEGTRLFFATSLPYGEARQRCREVWDFFQGGIFAGGAHRVLKEGQTKQQEFLYLESDCVDQLKQQAAEAGCNIRVYGVQGGVYKVTLLYLTNRAWTEERIKALDKCMEPFRGSVRWFVEDRYFQVVSAKAKKEEGVKRLCAWLGISPREAVAAGDSLEDNGMIALCENSGKRRT